MVNMQGSQVTLRSVSKSRPVSSSAGLHTQHQAPGSSALLWQPCLLLWEGPRHPSNLQDSSPHASPSFPDHGRPDRFKPGWRVLVAGHFGGWGEGRSCRVLNWCWLESLKDGECPTNDFIIALLLSACGLQLDWAVIGWVFGPQNPLSSGGYKTVFLLEDLAL